MLQAFLERLEPRWGTSADWIVVFANSLWNGAEIDLVCILPSAILVADFKSHRGRLTGTENGPWQANGVLVKGGRKENPYQQLRDNKFSILNWLESKSLLTGRNLGHISAGVVFGGSVEDHLELSAKVRSWFYPTDLDNCTALLTRLASPELQIDRKEALEIILDVVETKAASYLGLLIPHPPKEPRPGWTPKPLPRFAIKDAAGRAWSLVGPGIKRLKFEVGAPVTVVIGRQNGEGRETIVHVSARPEGKYWDCLEPGAGVVVRETSHEKPLKIFIADTGDELGIENPAKSLRVGDGVRIGIARNPKNNRLDAFNMELGELPDRDMKFIQGQLRRNPKGFGFVDDAFVPPYIVESVAPDVVDVSGLAVFGKHPVKGGRSWRVIRLDAV
ncbi:NERD domain-containing protein [Castellaniella defragrans]|nr:NERD domain-containing protein [Castellaniella defragrans]